MKEKIKSIFLTAGMCFTAITFSLTLIYAYFLETSVTRPDTNVTWQQFAGLLACILAFSFVVGLDGLVMSARKIPQFAKRFIHFSVVMIASFVFLVLAAGKLSSPQQVLFILLGTAVVYFILWAVRAIVRAAVLGRRSSHSEYESILKNGK